MNRYDLIFMSDHNYYSAYELADNIINSDEWVAQNTLLMLVDKDMISPEEFLRILDCSTEYFVTKEGWNNDA